MNSILLLFNNDTVKSQTCNQIKQKKHMVDNRGIRRKASFTKQGKFKQVVAQSLNASKSPCPTIQKNMGMIFYLYLYIYIY